MECLPLTNLITKTANQISSFDAFMKGKECAKAFLLKDEIGLNVEKILSELRWRNLHEVFHQYVDMSEISREYDGNEFDPECFTLSPSGRYLAVIDGGSFSIIDLEKNQKIGEYSLPDAYQDDTFINNLHFDNEDRIRFTFTFKPGLVKRKTFGSIYGVDLSGENNNLSGISSGDKLSISLKNREGIYYYTDGNEIEIGNNKITIDGADRVRKMELSSSGKFLLAECVFSLTGGRSIKKVIILKADSLEKMQEYQADEYAMSFNDELVTKAGFNSVIFSRFDSDEPGSYYDYANIIITAMTFDADGKNLLIADDENVVHVISLESKSEVGSFPLEIDFYIHWMKVTPDNNKLIVGSGISSRTIKIFERGK